MDSSTADFNVLALTGGGFRGFYTAQVLAHLEAHTKRPLARSFDLIAGTSIGGILALALAFEVPMSLAAETFRRRGQAIFTKKAPIGLFAAKYSNVALKETIAEILPADAKLSAAKHAVIVPAVNLTHGAPQIFKTRHSAAYSRDYKYPVGEIALATSAAPTYFPIAEVDSQLFADGGLFANAPDLPALHEAEKFLGVDPKNVQMLSIGTTTAKYAISHRRSRDLGIVGWMRGGRLLETILSAQQQMSVQVVQHRLQERYVRIDNEPSGEVWTTLGLDRADDDAASTLAGLANRDATSALARHELRRILEHDARSWIIQGEE